MKTIFAMILAVLALSPFAQAESQLEVGRKAILSQQGCYIIDYSYVETEAIKPGYVKDPRVYDVNKVNTVKEYIYADELSDTRIRIQHILFFADASGKVNKDAMLKHQVEDWEYNAPFVYDFQKPQTWDVKANPENVWTRRITNLDDGLRYQCAAAWSENKHYTDWQCANYAPIPGRETRDMGRKDYNTLDRNTRIITYQNSWLERQENIKTIHNADSTRTQLVKELGKNWYVRLPDEDCVDAKAFAYRNTPFWNVLREAWDEVLTGKETFREVSDIGSKRYMEILGLEQTYATKDLSDKSVKAAAKSDILKTIEKYRKHE